MPHNKLPQTLLLKMTHICYSFCTSEVQAQCIWVLYFGILQGHNPRTGQGYGLIIGLTRESSGESSGLAKYAGQFWVYQRQAHRRCGKKEGADEHVKALLTHLVGVGIIMAEAGRNQCSGHCCPSFHVAPWGLQAFPLL